MARDGSGTYSLPATFAVANQQASSATANSIMDDIAQALTDSLNKDGSKALEGNQSMGGNKLTNLAAATVLTDAAQLSQVQKGNVAQATTVGGTVDAITLAFTPAITSYTVSMRVRWTSGGANTVVDPNVNIDGLGAKTIKKNPGGAALAASDLGAAGTINEVVYNGTDFILMNPPAAAQGLASTTEVLTGTDATKAVTPNALAALWEQGAAIASAGTIAIGEGGYFNVTGTTTITDIDPSTDKAGRPFVLRFDGILTLTHGAALILPGGANITTAAGDVAAFVSEGSDVVRCLDYRRASGRALVEPAAGGMTLLGTISTASGSSANISGLTLTSYKLLLLVYDAVSASADTSLLLGTSTSDDVTIVASLLASGGAPLNGLTIVELGNGVAVSITAGANTGSAGSTYMQPAHPLTTASTAVSLAPASGSFDGGACRVYGVA
jgi:hypothetical protein